MAQRGVTEVEVRAMLERATGSGLCDMHEAAVRRADYDVIADDYDRRYQNEEYADIERTLLGFVGEDRNVHVLEVGCGTGHWLHILAKRSIPLAGVDSAWQMICRAAIKVPKARLGQGQAESLPFRTAAFDRIFCINALHHFLDKPAFIGEARRVLRFGGTFMTIGLDPHMGTDQWWIYDYFEDTRETDQARYPSSDQTREWLKAVGFTACETRQVQRMTKWDVEAREAFEVGLTDQSQSSQLALLTTSEYGKGIDRIRAAMEKAEGQGTLLRLSANLRMYATFGVVAA